MTAESREGFRAWGRLGAVALLLLFFGVSVAHEISHAQETGDDSLHCLVCHLTHAPLALEEVSPSPSPPNLWLPGAALSSNRSPVSSPTPSLKFSRAPPGTASGGFFVTPS